MPRAKKDAGRGSGLDLEGPDSAKDPVDAEFIEVSDNYRPQKPTPRQHKPWGYIMMLGCIVAGGGYWLFRPVPVANFEPPVAGWEALSSCSSVTSLEGDREMEFSDNQRAALWNLTTPSERKKSGIWKRIAAEGKWEYDVQSKRYSITLNGETTTYTLLSPKRQPMCVLFKGDLGTADLRESWFSSETSD
jgi:hypothetical protein